MEKVKVVKAIPGILNVGDELVSVAPGEDFVLSETEVTQGGSSNRWVSLDYVTVSENIPAFFTVEIENECDSCDCCDCWCEEDIELDNSVVKTDKEIQDRYDFFQKQFNKAASGSEAEVVYQNLMWFIDWLRGKAQLLA